MEKQVSFETVMDALYKVALYDTDGHTAADANGLLELGYSYDDNASEFMAALNKTEKSSSNTPFQILIKTAARFNLGQHG